VLRTNLSTRPFYNERVVHLLAALAGVIVFTITLFNVIKVVELSRRNTELATRSGRDRTEADRLTREATQIRRGIDPKELSVVAAAAREANTLIDQRTFSWTAFFNHLETTLPPDVMLVSVRPAVDTSATRVSMTVLGRTAEDIDEFIEKLEATGAFEHILARQSDRTDDGLNRAVLDAEYTPEHEDTTPADTAKPGAPGKPGEAVPPAAPAAGPDAGRKSRPGTRPPAPAPGRSGRDKVSGGMP
jgi:hypothetical protein